MRPTGARLHEKSCPPELQASHRRPPVEETPPACRIPETRPSHGRPPVSTGARPSAFWAKFSSFLCFLGIGINTLQPYFCCSDLFMLLKSFGTIFQSNWSHRGEDYSSDFLRSCQSKISSCWDRFRKKRSQLLCAPRVRKDT